MSDLVNALRKAHAVSGYSSTLWSKAADEIQALRARVAELEAGGEQSVKVHKALEHIKNAWLGQPLDDEALNRDENGFKWYGSSDPKGYAANEVREAYKAMLAAQEPTQ